MSAKYKPGSRKQQVWEVFEAKGADEAYKFGRTQNLTSGTLRSWMTMWGQKVTLPAEEKPPTKMKAKRPITIVWAPTEEAYLILEGPQVSEIFRTKMPITEYISNIGPDGKPQWRYKDDGTGEVNRPTT